MPEDERQNGAESVSPVSRSTMAREMVSGEEEAPEPYNFSRAGQISHDQMRAIGTVNDLFARNLMHTLGAWLRTQFHVKLAAGKQMSYAELLGRLKEPTYVCSVRMEPLGALGLIELDLSLASPIIDLLLGGIGRSCETRELTDIEEAILASVLQMIVRELNGAWQPVGLRFAFEKRETAAQVARMMPSTEKTLCVSFEVNMPEAQGSLNVCLPVVVLNAILRQMVSDRERPRRRSEEAERRIRDLLAEASFGAVLQFPPLRLRARDLADIAPGTILRLPLPRHSPAELRVGGIPLTKARPVRMGEHRGAQIQTDRIAESSLSQGVQQIGPSEQKR
ncbi:flagellar motor switch protein FliM [Granulicella arctica]|uniref:Flagellar motor switch protein FliM n=1 Tax=Granulicella arctica TaxID=940613 RepID=A0A7Y9PIA1_9BACT|nr:flagellar motor switch protein FliM [Granulicella arctica]NYF80356.1 flagellar motor switch protein FliM [Granulicella arctica]